MTAYRLDRGGLIDRSRTHGFTFDGASLTGHPGDTLASALLANDRLIVGRSFKYHRPRGVATAGPSEPNALVTVGKGVRRTPNSRATMVELYEGLTAESQNRWPSLRFDVGALNGLLSPFLSAGFYYKTFMWPAPFWEKVYEPFIRRAAGLGRGGYDADLDRYEKLWAHCDLLVVGAGPAGLAAALAAGRAGANVILADENVQLGGALLTSTARIADEAAPDFAAKLVAELDACSNVRVMPRTTVFGWYDDMVFGAAERVSGHLAAPEARQPQERLWRIIARRAILATGAEERPLVFPGNDRPGIMTAEAAVTYARRYGVAAGRKIAVFANSTSGALAAANLAAAGVNVVALVDARPNAGTLAPSVRVFNSALVTRTAGRASLRAITVRHAGGEETFDVDALAMSGGFNPRIHLACHRGAKPRWSDKHHAFLAPGGLKTLALAGSASGATTLADCLAEGSEIAVTLLAEVGLSARPAVFGLVSGDVPADTMRPLWRVRGTKAFVDFQNDVTAADLSLAAREGYGHVELAKRYTTNGMATDQGKLSNVNAVGILAEERRVSPAEVGATTFRPFYTPVSFGALAGASTGLHFQPVRRSPMHAWAEKNGAKFVETGLWMRSSWFPRAGETGWRDSVDREARTVRETAGLCDVSTLGKIEIFGADASEFLNRVYCNGFGKLSVGKARYGLMLREDGMIYDDGTTSRLSEDHFFMTTTTALAGGVMNHLEFCAQVLWPEIDVRLASATDQWAQMAIAGPNARMILQTIVDDDISNASFPFLSARSVSLFGGRIDGRLYRISFSGELAYELGVSAGYGEAVGDALMEAGRSHGLCAYGAEALGVLRIEKGHITHAEINGAVTPGDVGFDRMVSKAKVDFVGKHMLDREGLVDPSRPRLVGVKPLEPKRRFRTGAHILAKGAPATLDNDQGYVTSSCFSPHVGSTIGLALVERGPDRHGEEIVVWDGLAAEVTPAVLCDPVFVDPTNERLHA
jgi:heterotetrameric sarcosine oxidase alpha subunit